MASRFAFSWSGSHVAGLAHGPFENLADGRREGTRGLARQFKCPLKSRQAARSISLNSRSEASVERIVKDQGSFLCLSA